MYDCRKQVWGKQLARYCHPARCPPPHPLSRYAHKLVCAQCCCNVTGTSSCGFDNMHTCSQHTALAAMYMCVVNVRSSQSVVRRRQRWGHKAQTRWMALCERILPTHTTVIVCRSAAPGRSALGCSWPWSVSLLRTRLASAGAIGEAPETQEHLAPTRIRSAEARAACPPPPAVCTAAARPNSHPYLPPPQCPFGAALLRSTHAAARPVWALRLLQQRLVQPGLLHTSEG